jgi:hypothetical protein
MALQLFYNTVGTRSYLTKVNGHRLMDFPQFFALAPPNSSYAITPKQFSLAENSYLPVHYMNPQRLLLPFCVQYIPAIFKKP